MEPSLVCAEKWSRDFKRRSSCVVFFSLSISIFVVLLQKCTSLCTHRWSGLSYLLFIHPVLSVTCLLFRSLPWQGNKGKCKRRAHDSELINPEGRWAKRPFFFFSSSFLPFFFFSWKNLESSFSYGSDFPWALELWPHSRHLSCDNFTRRFIRAKLKYLLHLKCCFSFFSHSIFITF